MQVADCVTARIGALRHLGDVRDDILSRGFDNRARRALAESQVIIGTAPVGMDSGGGPGREGLGLPTPPGVRERRDRRGTAPTEHPPPPDPPPPQRPPRQWEDVPPTPAG